MARYSPERKEVILEKMAPWNVFECYLLRITN